MNTTKNKFVYFLNNTMYINVTNLCTNNCVFCIRDLSATVAGSKMKLDTENILAKDIIEEVAANEPEKRDEIVFCGYGEPLIKLDVVKEVATFIKQNYPNISVRINSNGQGNLIHRRDIVPQLTGLIDKISVSLNAEDEDNYEKITKCKFDKKLAYQSVKDFIKKCKNANIQTTATVVSGFEGYDVDVDKCRKIAEELGVEFKVREWLSEGYK